MTVFAFVVGLVLMIVGLAVSIALHEIGHLVPAKLFGVRVGQYMIGFGPTLWSRRFRGTEYGFKAIPLGGYISMAGMYPPSAADGTGSERGGRAGGGFFATMVQDARLANDETMVASTQTGVFYRLPVWKRVVIMLGGPVMNLILAIVLFTIVFSGIGVQTATATVASVSQCVIPASADRTTCEASDPIAPAARAGFQPGDVIASIDGTAVSTFDDASAVIRDSPGVSLDVVVRRDGADQRLTVTPIAAERQVTQPDGTTETATVGFVGIAPVQALVPQPVLAGPEAAIQNVGMVAQVIVQLPVKVYDTAVSLVTGGARDPNGPLSIVGAGIIAGEVASSDTPVLNRVAGFLGLLASLNIALFVFNMVPLLPLDGGHIVVALWDGLKRALARLFGRPPPKPVDAAKLVPVTFVVVVALAVMFAVLVAADVVNPVSIFGG